MCKSDNKEETTTTTTVTTPIVGRKLITSEQCVLKARPKNVFDALTDCEIKEVVMDLGDDDDDDDDNNDNDEVIIKIHAVGVDAFIRTMLNDTSNPVHGKVELGGVIPAMAIGTVIHHCGNNKNKTNKNLPKIGTFVAGLFGAQTYAKVSSRHVMKVLKLPGVTEEKYLNLFSASGLTAHIGMYHVTKSPRKGETVVVSAAAGATGSIAVQLAKLSGARVIGIAGGSHKKQFLLEQLQLDGAIDYKDVMSKSLSEQLQEHCPNGIDFFYDNVGGDILNTVLLHLARNARVVVCGAVSQYSKETEEETKQNGGSGNGGPSNYIKLAEQSATMTGFVMFHYPLSMIWSFFKLFWLSTIRRTITSYEQIYDITDSKTVDKDGRRCGGIYQFPTALQTLYESGNHQIGKPIIQLR